MFKIIQNDDGIVSSLTIDKKDLEIFDKLNDGTNEDISMIVNYCHDLPNNDKVIILNNNITGSKIIKIITRCSWLIDEEDIEENLDDYLEIANNLEEKMIQYKNYRPSITERYFVETVYNYLKKNKECLKKIK